MIGEEMMTMMKTNHRDSTDTTGTVGPVAALYLPAYSSYGMLFPRDRPEPATAPYSDEARPSATWGDK